MSLNTGKEIIDVAYNDKPDPSGNMSYVYSAIPIVILLIIIWGCIKFYRLNKAYKHGLSKLKSDHTR